MKRNERKGEKTGSDRDEKIEARDRFRRRGQIKI